MQIDDCYYLGYVKKQHGLDGEVSLYLDADDPTRYKKLGSVLLEVKGLLVPFFIDQISIKQGQVIVRFTNTKTLADAEMLVGCAIYLPLEMLPPLTGKNAFYYHEIEGYEVFDTEKGLIGQVATVYDNPRQAIISIMAGSKEILVPVDDKIILEVDKKERKLHIQAPEGLIDLYL